MVSSKHATKIVVVLMTVAMLFCLMAVGYSSKLTETFGGTGVSMEYESKLFNTDEIITLDIQIDEDDWNDMLANAMSEEYYECDVVVNGEKFNNVAIRTKGNTSLSTIANDPDTDRYSLKVEFDHFVEGQTCYGLDKLILNNNYADSTNMKEAIIYDMYQFIGADASLYNYAEVSVNGEYTGVYLALEGVESSFMLRNFGTQDGELYKPESMGVGGEKSENDNKPSQDENQLVKDNSNDNSSENTNESKTRPQGGFSMGGGGGANLNYTDDELDSYSTIWEGEVTGTGKKDHKRVVKALKNISEGKNLEKYLDMDNILKYMAVHVFAVNMDSLSGSMAHNYYLYEYKGQLNMLPWDYNLSFGGFTGGGETGGSSVVNDAIDTPFSSTDFFDAILEDEEYCAKYHEYLQKLVDEYVNGGRFEKVYNRIRSQIDELVKTDPTAFYSYDEYEAGAEMLCKTVMLRAESINGQLNGTIPSTDEGQKADSSALIDVSGIDVKVMGQMNMGGGNMPQGGGPGNMPQGGGPGNMPENFDPSNMPEDFDPSNMPEGFDPSNAPEGFDPSNMPGGNSNQSGSDEKSTEKETVSSGSKDSNQKEVTDEKADTNEKTNNNENSEANDNSDSNDKSSNRFSKGNMPSFSGTESNTSDKTMEKNLVMYGVCFALMILSLIVLKFKKRNY